MIGHPFIEKIDQANLVVRTGRVRRILPTFLEADGPNLPLGALCNVEARAREPVVAEVIAVNPQSILLAPFESVASTFSGARVEARTQSDLAPVGDAFRGRAVDALGQAIDKGPQIAASVFASLDGSGAAPLERTSPVEPLVTGVRAIDAFLTLGHGQRVGIFAASGVGKSSLINQLARQIPAERCVICLVGERGREVEALWSRQLPDSVKAKSVLVAATADHSAALRVRAARYALTLAEHWRGEGRQVLLLIDSVTRLAMALREIGLAAGEPPTVRAYTPGVFAAIPKLVERCGALKAGGSISAVMTVLSETDDVDDPISELMKSLLDGHIVLSRSLAEQGHFPAIDVGRSISRMASSVMRSQHRKNAAAGLSLLSQYEASRTLIETGVYASGSNAALDRAIERRPGLLAFLKQAEDEASPLSTTTEALARALQAPAT